LAVALVVAPTVKQVAVCAMVARVALLAPQFPGRVMLVVLLPVVALERLALEPMVAMALPSFPTGLLRQVLARTTEPVLTITLEVGPVTVGLLALVVGALAPVVTVLEMQILAVAVAARAVLVGTSLAVLVLLL
jgi:hypothetical protein